MVNEKHIPSQSIQKHIVNIASNETKGDFFKNHTSKPISAVNKVKQQFQKTTEQRVSFIEKFAEIVKNNIRVKDNYLIVFADVNFSTQVNITDKDKVRLDLLKLLSKTEFEAFTDLLNVWNK